MPAPRQPISRPGLIFCEGIDDERFLVELLAFLSIDSIWVERADGESQFQGLVRTLRGRGNFEQLRALAIVRDADTDAGRKFESVTDLLQAAGYPVPPTPARLITGRFPSATTVTVGVVGVFIMPDGDSPGTLEDLCLRAIEQDQALECTREFLDCVRTHTGVTCPDQHIPKAKLNSWLASRANPTLRLGQARASRDIPPDSDAFGPIRQFLQELAEAATRPGQSNDDA
jgi:hypothetical protein